MKNLEGIDEIIERFERSAEYQRAHRGLSGCHEFKQIAEWLRELKAYKEQQPCDDAISREAALMCMTGVNLLSKKPEELISLFDKRIKEIPSVTPKQNVGKWKLVQRGKSGVAICEESFSKMKPLSVEIDAVLDKIAADIKTLSPEPTAYDVVDGNPIKDTVWEVLSDVMQIIDKYKTESEEEG